MYKTKLIEALQNDGYEDIRYELLDRLSISVKGREIKDVNVIKKKGGNARSLCGGGWGTYSFNKIEDCKQAIENCIKSSKKIKGSKKLASVAVIKDVVTISSSLDPRSISLDDKKELLLKYCNMIMDYKGIAFVEGDYYENYTRKYFVNNEGAEIDQEQLICGMMFTITAREGGLTQQTKLYLGGNQSFEGMLNMEEEIQAKCKLAVDLLSAKPVAGGIYDVIMDSDVGGLFVHEAFGHLSESDILLGNEKLKEMMAIGTVFGSPVFSIVDDPSIPGIPGNYIYDDEGVRGTKTYLIKNGVLNGRLHSRETAGELNEAPTGHARAMNYNFSPLVRMGNIYIEKGNSSLEEMVSSIDNGLYLFGCIGGQTAGDTFTFAVNGGYVIKNGKMCEMVRDIALTGNLLSTLKNIEMVGDTLDFTRIGGCGKSGQSLLASGKGSPAIKVKSIMIGGR